MARLTGVRLWNDEFWSYIGAARTSAELFRAPHYPDSIPRKLDALRGVERESPSWLSRAHQIDLWNLVTKPILVVRWRRATTARVISFLTGQNDNSQAEQRFWEAIDFPDAGKLLQLPGFTSEAITADSTNAEALTKMDDLARKTLVALDAENRPKGVAKRDAIVTHLLVQLASGSTGPR
ncbi:CBS domain-containing protein [Rhizobium herbae]|uniref:Uncharacterized protein n=1 Tax=Rhizobium herbae TaxID=508661 RepID=A0ABS4EUF4_9HYPH|nr:hypothetical protein [Rhizobium herbae]MBP1861558.1 hypothetical protein [Rhizobium herbae]